MKILLERSLPGTVGPGASCSLRSSLPKGIVPSCAEHALPPKAMAILNIVVVAQFMLSPTCSESDT